MKNLHNKNGFALITLLITIFMVMMIGVATTQLVLTNTQHAQSQRLRLSAQLAADAAVDHAVQELNQYHDWSGVGETELHDDGKIRSTYTSSIEDGDDSFTKFINVTGRSYANNEPSPKSERKYRVQLRGVGGGNYSIVTGVGGLTMRNNSAILDGSVYVNGEINMSHNSQIGLTILPVEVSAAHQTCPNPPDTNFPEVCDPGENGEPINISGNARIYGEVKGTNQTSGNRMSNPGLVSNCVPPAHTTDCVPAIELPTYDRDAHKAAVQTTISGNQAECPLGLGVKYWPANVKIEGNVTISNLCIVYVDGPVWITGNLQIKNLGQMILGAGVSETTPIMVDGQNGVSLRNASTMLPNVLGLSGFRVITYWSDASCSPECTDVTGAELHSSKNHTTIDIRNAAVAPVTEFYARWSKIQVANSGNVGALVGQEIELSNSAAITLGAKVSGLDTPSAWVIQSYKRVFD